MIPAVGYSAEPAGTGLDILLINLTNWPGNPVYPYAFVQVSALARRAGLTIRRWDGLGLTRDLQLRCISELACQHRPRAIAFTIRQADSTEANEYLGTVAEASTGWFPLEDIHAAIRQLRRVCDSMIVLGGFTFTVNPISAAEYLEPDFGVIGEPDDFICKFDRIMNGETDGVANLLFRQNGVWRQNQRVYYGPLDEIEYTPEIVDEVVRFHGERPFRESHLAAVPGLNTCHDTGRAVAVEISRGCRFGCAFCCEPLVKGKSVRLRNPNVIEAEVRNLLQFGIRYLWLVCSELNLAKSHILDIAERLIRLNTELELPVYWRAYFLPVKFSKEELRILLRSGLLLEQNGPFSDLSENTLRSMHEPYRAKHALRHIRDLIELNQEPEFAHRAMTRWTLWSWLVNPYATLESVRLTLETFAKHELDRHFDLASGYPALRVYECLTNLPDDVHDRTICLTGDENVSLSVIHPSFYYSCELLNHCGGIDALHDFFSYAQDTFLSRRYRTSRDWLTWSDRQDSADIGWFVTCENAGSVSLPPWIDHPDLDIHDPVHWRDEANMAWRVASEDWSRFRTNLAERDPAVASAMVAALLHQGYSRAFAHARALFRALNLLETDTVAIQSPFRALVALIPRFIDEFSLFEYAEKRFGPGPAFVLRYYVHALNLRMQPQLAFIASVPTSRETVLPLRPLAELQRTGP